MSKFNSSKIVHILWSMLLGLVSFLISGVMSCMVILHLDNYILATIMAGGIGGLLLGLFLSMRQKIIKMAIAGIIAAPIGLFTSFILAEGFSSLIPSIGNTNIPDIIAIIFMGTIFGAVFGAIIYGRKSLWLFSVVCGTVSIPFGLLVGAMNSGHYVKVWLENLFKVFGKIDLNFLAIIMAFGIGIGLSIGLYNILKQTSAED